MNTTLGQTSTQTSFGLNTNPLSTGSLFGNSSSTGSTFGLGNGGTFGMNNNGMAMNRQPMPQVAIKRDMLIANLPEEQKKQINNLINRKIRQRHCMDSIDFTHINELQRNHQLVSDVCGSLGLFQLRHSPSRLSDA